MTVESWYFRNRAFIVGPAMSDVHAEGTRHARSLRAPALGNRTLSGCGSGSTARIHLGQVLRLQVCLVVLLHILRGSVRIGNSLIRPGHAAHVNLWGLHTGSLDIDAELAGHRATALLLALVHASDSHSAGLLPKHAEHIRHAGLSNGRGPTRGDVRDVLVGEVNLAVR